MCLLVLVGKIITETRFFDVAFWKKNAFPSTAPPQSIQLNTNGGGSSDHRLWGRGGCASEEQVVSCILFLFCCCCWFPSLLLLPAGPKWVIRLLGGTSLSSILYLAILIFFVCVPFVSHTHDASSTHGTARFMLLLSPAFQPCSYHTHKSRFASHTSPLGGYDGWGHHSCRCCCCCLPLHIQVGKAAEAKWNHHHPLVSKTAHRTSHSSGNIIIPGPRKDNSIKSTAPTGVVYYRVRLPSLPSSCGHFLTPASASCAIRN